MHCRGHEKNLCWVVWETGMMSLYVDDKLLINKGNIVCGLFYAYTGRRASVLDPEWMCRPEVIYDPKSSQNWKLASSSTTGLPKTLGPPVPVCWHTRMTESAPSAQRVCVCVHVFASPELNHWWVSELSGRLMCQVFCPGSTGPCVSPLHKLSLPSLTEHCQQREDLWLTLSTEPRLSWPLTSVIVPPEIHIR